MVFAHLEVEVGLLETGSGHGLRADLLAARPGLCAVRGLLDLGGCRGLGDGGRGLCLGRSRRRCRFQLTAGGGEGPLRKARQPACCPQT